MKDIQKFISGFQRFQQKYFVEQQELFDGLRQGQRPKTLVIGCSDSRVDPALLTDCDPGDMFVIRNVANLVPPCEIGTTHQGVSSALEFAVCSLNVERIIVMGHRHCGGIRALMNGVSKEVSPDRFISRWMNIAEPAKQQVLRELHDKPIDDQLRAAELASILVSLENLMTFSWVNERAAAGKLTLHGWYFDIDEGALLAYSPRQSSFLPVVCPIEHAPPSRTK